MLADREKQRSYGRTKPNFAPFHGFIREYFKHHRKENGREAKGERWYGAGGEEMAPSSLQPTDGVP